MEDTNQDSETSSTSSWILLSNEDALLDMVTEEHKEISFEEVLQNFNEVDSKNNHSDIESDGISIISESDFFQNGNKSDEDSAIVSEDEKLDDTEDLTSNCEVYADKLEDIKQLNEESGKLETKGDEILSLSNKFSQKEPKIKNITDADLFEVESVCAKMKIVNDQNKPLGISIINCLKNYVQIYDYKELLSWPSLLCTSVLIVAVIIFPCSLSKDESTGTLEPSNMGQLDLPFMSDQKSVDQDYPEYFKQVYKPDDLYQTFVKKNKKEIKQLRKNKALDIGEAGSIENPKSSKQNDKIIKYQKYRKKIYDSTNENGINLSQIGDKEYRTQDNNFYRVRIGDYNFENYHADRIVKHKHKDKLRDKLFERKLRKWAAQLYKKEKILQKREKLLNAWEHQLIEREKYIQMKEGNDNIHQFKENLNSLSKQKIASNDIKRMFGGKWQYMKRKYKKLKKHEKLIKKENYDNVNWESQSKSKEKKIKKYSQRRALGEGSDGARSLKKKAKKFSVANDINTTFSKDNERIENISNIDYNNLMYLKFRNNMKKNMTKIFEEDNILSGEWYIDLVRARQDIRKREEKALWWFDRAEYRRNKRNKAYWYFQYMFNRENLRYRHKSI